MLFSMPIDVAFACSLIAFAIAFLPSSEAKELKQARAMVWTPKNK